jgi:hypothetical protein
LKVIPVALGHSATRQHKPRKSRKTLARSRKRGANENLRRHRHDPIRPLQLQRGRALQRRCAYVCNRYVLALQNISEANMKSLTGFMARHQTLLVVAIVLIVISSTKNEVDETNRVSAFKAGRYSTDAIPLTQDEQRQLRELCTKPWPDNERSNRAKARTCYEFGG